LSDQRARIREAIAALEGKQRSSSKGTTKTAAKKTPSEDDVKSILHCLISEHGNVSSDDLYKLLEAKVLKAGKAKFGLRSKFAKVLAAFPAKFKPENANRTQSANAKAPT